MVRANMFHTREVIWFQTMLLFRHNGDTHLMHIIKGTNRAANFFESPTRDQYFPAYSLVLSRKLRKNCMPSVSFCIPIL
jgi:hypothetical protein